MVTRLSFAAVMILLALLGAARADEHGRPLKFTQRYRVAVQDDVFEARTRQVLWQPAQTAIIVCDMWDAHHCLNAVRRLEELAPVMNQVLVKARGQGVLVIHAPSSCMVTYRDHPA